MANPNIVNVATIAGRTAVASLTNVSTEIVNNATSSGKIFKINSIMVSNYNSTNSAGVFVDFYRSSVGYDLACNTPIAPKDRLDVLSKDVSIYLQEGDILRASASANNFLKIIIPYEEISE